MLTRKVRTGIVFSLVLAFIVMVVIAFYGDAPRMLQALANFRWQYLPLILGFTLFNYLGRFGKWQYYLHRLGIKLPVGKSLLIFLSGLSMAITPGKVGELLKSYQLKRATGTPISQTAPIIVAERLTDGIAMIALASTGLLLYRFGWEMLLALLLVGLIGIVLIQNRRFALWALGFGERLPFISRIAHNLHTFYESAYTLLQWRPLLFAVCLGIVSWMGESVSLYFVYVGLDIPASLDLFFKATFILAVSSLIGSASGLPGGLGTADGSLLGLTRTLVTSSPALSSTATLLIRFCTLWFGLFIGVCAVLGFRAIQRVDLSEKAERHEVPDQPLLQREHDTLLPLHQPLSERKPASTSAHSGDNFV